MIFVMKEQSTANFAIFVMNIKSSLCLLVSIVTEINWAINYNKVLWSNLALESWDNDAI